MRKVLPGHRAVIGSDDLGGVLGIEGSQEAQGGALAGALALEEEFAKASLVRVRADEQRNLVLVPVFKGGDGVFRNELIIHRGRVAGIEVNELAGPPHHGLARTHQIGKVFLAQVLHRGTPGQGHAVDQLARPQGGLGAGMDHGNRRGLGNGAVEEALRGRARHEGEHRRATGRFAHEGDGIRITAKGRDIVAHPLQRQDLIGHRRVSAAVPAQAAQIQVAQGIEAEVNGYVDHVHAGGQLKTAEHEHVGRAHNEAAAVQVDHHGKLLFSARAHDVEVQAVLGADNAIGPGIRGLRGRWAELAAIAHTLPGRCGLRRAEAVVPGGGITKRDTAPGKHRPGANGAIGAQVFLYNAAHPPGGSAHGELICQGVLGLFVRAAGAFVGLLRFKARRRGRLLQRETLGVAVVLVRRNHTH